MSSTLSSTPRTRSPPLTRPGPGNTAYNGAAVQLAPCQGPNALQARKGSAWVGAAAASAARRAGGGAKLRKMVGCWVGEEAVK